MGREYKSEKNMVRTRLEAKDDTEKMYLRAITQWLKSELLTHSPIELLARLKNEVKNEADASIQMTEAEPNKDEDIRHYTTSETEDVKNIATFATRLKTSDDLVAYHGIDLDVWEIKSLQTKYYEQGAKLPDGTIVVTPLHGMTLNFVKREAVKIDLLKKFRDDLLADLSALQPKPSETLPINKVQIMNRQGLFVELMITDLHLGKVGFDFETGDYNWSNKECRAAYDAVIDDALMQLKGEKIGGFLLPSGNDFLNIDNPYNTTTKGTPQMAGHFYEHLFRLGTAMIEGAIERLRTVAPVQVVFVPGNHDANSTISMGQVIEALYRGIADVSVDAGMNKRKYLTFGDVAIGYFHFDEVQPQKAAQAWLVDAPHLVAKKFKAIHGGHLHKNGKRLIMDLAVKEELYGIEVEVCPSLSPNDLWHNNKLFKGNLRRSKSFVWSPGAGLLQEFYYNL